VKTMLMISFDNKEINYSPVYEFIQNSQPSILSSSFGTFTASHSLTNPKPVAEQVDLASCIMHLPTRQIRKSDIFYQEINAVVRTVTVLA
jgi:hypothetical protein